MAFCIKDYSVLEKYTTQTGRAAGQCGPVTAIAREAFLISVWLYGFILSAAESLNKIKVTSEFPKVQYASQQERWRLLPDYNILRLELVH